MKMTHHRELHKNFKKILFLVICRARYRSQCFCVLYDRVNEMIARQQKNRNIPNPVPSTQRITS